MICTPFRRLVVKPHRDLDREPSRLAAKSYPVFEISKIEGFMVTDAILEVGQMGQNLK